MRCDHFRTGRENKALGCWWLYSPTGHLTTLFQNAVSKKSRAESSTRENTCGSRICDILYLARHAKMIEMIRVSVLISSFGFMLRECAISMPIELQRTMSYFSISDTPSLDLHTANVQQRRWNVFK